MKNLILFACTLFCLSVNGQTSFKAREKFLGVEVIKQHTILYPGDSLKLPGNSYIMEVIMISNGDYMVYSNNEPFYYPAAEGITNIIFRNEGSFVIEGQVTEKKFDPQGNERYGEEAVISKNACFHLYYFTPAPSIKINWKEVLIQ